ncbi:MAG: FAD synthetase family protein [Rikenellaceae bacterium]
MEVVFGFSLLGGIDSSVVSVGSFDGVHAGHRAIMSRMNTLRDGLKAKSGKQTKSVVVTFAPHPRHFIGGEDSFKLLNTLEEKIRLVESCGIDVMVVATFDKAFMNTTSAQFFDILVDKLSMKILMAGYNHRLGCDGAGGLESLSLLAHGHGVGVEVLPELFVGGLKVSSTVVRNTILDGDMKLAGELLCRNYSAVVDYIDSKLVVPSQKLLPPPNRYAVRVSSMCGNVLVDRAFIAVCERGSIEFDLCDNHECLSAQDKIIVEFV